MLIRSLYRIAIEGKGVPIRQGEGYLSLVVGRGDEIFSVSAKMSPSEGFSGQANGFQRSLGRLIIFAKYQEVSSGLVDERLETGP